jgi:hypothetical protein
MQSVEGNMEKGIKICEVIMAGQETCPTEEDEESR